LFRSTRGQGRSGRIGAPSPAATGDVFRIAVQSSVVRYHENDQLIHASTTLAGVNATVENARMSAP
jgi:hypothetical protein